MSPSARGASGRPCPTESVGADLRVRSLVLGAHIGAPLHGGGGKLPPYGDARPLSVIARRAAGPTRRSVFPREKDGSPRPLRGLGMTGRANARPPCERGQSPPPGGDWGIPLTENASYVAPSSVICSANATFPPGGRLGRRVRDAAPYRAAPSVGAGVLTGPRAATWGRPAPFFEGLGRPHAKTRRPGQDGGAAGRQAAAYRFSISSCSTRRMPRADRAEAAFSWSATRKII